MNMIVILEPTRTIDGVLVRRWVRNGHHLLLVGRLDGHLRGRPINLIAQNSDLTLKVSALLTLLTLRNSWRFSVKHIMAILKNYDLRLRIRTSLLGSGSVSALFARLMLARR